MRVFPASALLLCLGLSAVASAQDTPASIQDLSPQALLDLEVELLAWKLSPAGEVAKQNGFGPVSSSGMSIMGVDTLQNKQLQRLLDAKREIERIQKTQPHATFSLDSPFALMTPEEFAAYVGRGLEKVPAMRKSTRAVNRTLHEETEKRVLASLPATVDWQQYGCVTPPKNQAKCNTCAAFTTTAVVESAACIKSGAAKTLFELSQQDQISCGVFRGDCTKGQYIQNALDWFPRLNSGSVCTAESFVLANGTSPTTCQRYEDESVSCTKPDLGLAGYDGELFTSYNTATMMEKVAAQPLAIEINSKLLKLYKSGVLMGDEANCNAYPIDHAVLLTGYGEQDGVGYWRAKNSWGLAWGDQGYFKIERGYNGSDLGACGVETSYHYPVFASDDPSLVTRRSSPWKGNVQITGDVIDLISAVDAVDCSEKCRVKSECQAFSFDSVEYTCTRLSNPSSTEEPMSGRTTGRIVTRTQTDLQCLAPETHYDYPGNDIRTAQVSNHSECCDVCNKVDNCGAYVWTKFHGGSCYLKTKKGTNSVWKGPASDGSAYYIPAEVYKCQPLIQNTDLTGTDIGNVPASRAQSCCAECRLKNGCTGFTWTNANGGTCWLKSGAFTQVANTGAISGLV